MNIAKELKKLGVQVGEKLKLEEKNNIAKIVSDKLTNNLPELLQSYNELYMRLFNCEMYYADVDKKYGQVFYYYRNNTLYFDKSKDIKKVDKYTIQECIHYLQNFDKVNKKNKRAGLCKFYEFKVFGLGLNEATIQYIASKAIENDFTRINDDKITIYTNDKDYKYITSLIYQIIFLMGENQIINSCINSDEKFEDDLYNTFEENTERILKKFDIILDERNKSNKNKEKIINSYLQAQELIYKTYFSKICKRVNMIEEVDSQVEKLENYKEIIGKLLNNSKAENEFEEFKDKMESEFLKKYIEINKKKSRNALILSYKSKIHSMWDKVLNFAHVKTKKEEN